LKTYEAMFLLDDAKCSENYDGVVSQLKELLTRHGAEIASCEKWDQRRLCYPIKRRQRATYVLVHFQAAPEAIAPMRSACELSPTILRALILVDPDAARRAAPAVQEPAEKAGAPVPTASPEEGAGTPVAAEEQAAPDIEDELSAEPEQA
jgi:small subunit ribosomal protein S6